MANSAEKVYDLIRETVEAQGVSLWDVRFVKEGASWYLRVFIDKPGGVTIEDCTNVSHAIDPVIDEADPIDLSYYLEVCSPGLERELTRPQHYEQFIGQTVKIRLYQPQDGVKEWIGQLKSGTEPILLLTETGERSFPFKQIAKTTVCDFEN
ncbi:MAG: ribosome maturation factor RimP [Clostridia bacterium]|nr:ribosome maturation factor RimP [Clostridia bacterium]